MPGWSNPDIYRILLQGHFQLGLPGETVNFFLPGGGKLQGTRIHGQVQPTGLHEQLQQRRTQGTAQVRPSFAPVGTRTGNLAVAMGQRLNEDTA
jgi:hypothetical protein